MDLKDLGKSLPKTLVRHPEVAKRLREYGIGAEDLAQLANARRGDAARSIIVTTGGGPMPASIINDAESIIEETLRPPLLVTGADFELPVDEGLAQRLKSARHLIGGRLGAVGRVEVFDGVMKFPVGTAWMVSDGIAITNRHVAEKFAQLDDTGKPEMQKDLRGRPYKVVIDFKEEHGSTDEDEAIVEGVLYLPRASSTIADIALLRMAPGQRLPSPIPLLSGGAINVGRWVAVIGYPQPDDRLPDEAREVEEAYFSNIYGVKRLSPGEIDQHDVGGAPPWLLAHDATTLGGNSGSVLLDLETGSAAGIHFRGHYKKANYAIDSTEIRRVLASLDIPTVQARPPGPALPSHPVNKPDDADQLEAAEDLRAFAGYMPAFVDPDLPEFKIALPTLTPKAPGKPAKRNDGGGTVLTYRNFSVVMNAKRRLCYFSAVNINGEKLKSVKGRRPRWRFDKRLDAKFQIKDECYGLETEGKFSRGHMTRREDPNWGTAAHAIVSNRHTFYVPNACPQIQPFNAGVWFALEDYALENCKQDDMRISVFTGPVFRDDDPEYFGVQVPVIFWKVIAFKHDDTEELTATGYTLSQRDLLPTNEEFVFGQFRQRQVTIKSIEKLTGLSFGSLHEHDPFDDGSEALAFKPLRAASDIVFRKL
jgi:endonuclease G, mitochondrial